MEIGKFRMAKPPAAFRATTPKAITDEVLNFCKSIRSDTTPLLVAVQPDEHAIANRCHTNVPAYIEENGGSKANGWTIWEARYWLEAECHCNWADPAGTTIDITPKDDGESRILFLPDDSIQWDGHMIVPHRWPKVNDRYLKKWASLQGKRDAILRKYRADEPFSRVDEQRATKLLHDAEISLSAYIKGQKQRESNRRKKNRKNKSRKK